MNQNIAFIDIGELGWSLYLSAHIRWLKKKNPGTNLLVLTSPDRACLYDEWAVIHPITDDFYHRYSGQAQHCFGLYDISSQELMDFFEKEIPGGYKIPEDFPFDCHYYSEVFKGELEYAPYPSSISSKVRNRILIFPRHRGHSDGVFSSRNLPEEFYECLALDLCEKYSNLIITLIGTASGAYPMSKTIGKNLLNLDNRIGRVDSLQCLIDLCEESVVAIGGTSAPPKITLLQGVPTFIIGHEKKRFVKTENWMRTKVGFFEISKDGYNTLDQDKCLKKIERFVKKKYSTWST
jgi:ADP-heptose:LPS heptosyltransferase